MPHGKKRSVETRDYVIILGEPDTELAFEITDALYHLDFTVMPCITGRDIISYSLRYRKPHDSLLILSETDLPDIPGPEACKRIRMLGPDYEQILMFGMSGDPNDEACWSGVSPPGTFIERSGPDAPMTVSGSVVRNLIYVAACLAGEMMMCGRRRYG